MYIFWSCLSRYIMNSTFSWWVSCMILAFSAVYYQFLSHLQLYQHHPNDKATTTCPSLDDDSNTSPPNNYDSGDHTQDKCWTTPTISNIKWQSCWWQPSLFSMPASGLTKLAARIFFWCGTIWVVATSFHFHSCFNALCLFFFFFCLAFLMSHTRRASSLHDPGSPSHSHIPVWLHYWIVATVRYSLQVWQFGWRWDWYYVSMYVLQHSRLDILISYHSFVDRYMFMRFQGGDVGHKLTCEAMQCLLCDCKTLDKQPFTLKCSVCR